MAGLPPSYDEVVGPYSRAGKDISFQDFWPKCLNSAEKAKNGTFEDFRMLVQRANQWLKEHPHYEVFSCETVESKIYRPDELLYDSAYTLTKTGSAVRINGLRLWMRPNPAGELQTLKFMDCLPRLVDATPYQWEKTQFETLTQVVDRFNSSQRQAPLRGKIVSIDTISATYAKTQFDPRRIESFRTDSNDTYKCHRFYFLRIFILDGQPAEEVIGLADFTPDVEGHALVTSSSRAMPEHLLFPCVLDRARIWLRSRNNLRVTNIQTINTRYWKLHEKGRRLDTMNAYDYKPETRLRINFVRVAYTQPMNAPAGEGTLAMPPLNHRTFFPVLTANIRENRRQTLVRMQAWLRAANARVLCVETVYKMKRLKDISRELVGQQDPMVYDGEWHEVTSGESTEFHRHPVLEFFRVYLIGAFTVPAASQLPAVPKQEVEEECALL